MKKKDSGSIRHCLMITLLLMLLGSGEGAGLFAQAGPDDDVLAKAIRQRFAASRIGQNNFGVEVRNGIATLRGETPVSQHKGTATRLARLAGAREVINEITVKQTNSGRPRPDSESANREPVTETEATAGVDRAMSPTVAISPGTDDQAAEDDQLRSTEASPATFPAFTVTRPAGQSTQKPRRRRY